MTTPATTPADGELLPCPFCGSAPNQPQYDGQYMTASVICTACSATAYGSGFKLTATDEAREKWNRRATPSPGKAPEPIYQLQKADGSWIDQAEHNYRYNLQYPSNKVRIVYASPGKAEAERWIPVTERLPERNRDVIIALSTGAVVVGFYYGLQFGWDWPETDTDEDADAAATHWQPMPAAPRAAIQQERDKQ